ncbi:MAG TPA: OsmC family protein [Jiangellaceae bacterium]
MTELKKDANVRQGIDLEALEQFVEHASANPADVQFTFEATGEYEGRIAHTTAVTGPYEVGGERIDRLARRYSHKFGAHKEVEEALGFVDPTDREEVIEVALAALTGCINTAVASSALVRGIELDELVTTVTVGWDALVFLHVQDAVSGGTPTRQFNDLHIEITVSGPGLTEEDLAYLRSSVNRSAVYNLFSTANPTTPVVRAA